MRESAAIELDHANRRIIANFIVFEGIDGSGTTTQVELMERDLRAQGIEVHATCEPTTGIIGRAIRRALSGEERITPGTMAKLFAADRHEHLYDPENGILSRSSRGVTVLSDRYLFSSLAYQSIHYGFQRVFRLNEAFPLPEHLVFIDIPAEIGDERISSRGKREIYEQTHLQKQVRRFYHRIIQLYSDTDMQIHIFDGSLPIATLKEKIWRELWGPPIVKT